MLRIRKEANAHDYINSRMWDIFRATPSTDIAPQDLHKKAANGSGPLYMDMNPINSRTNTVEYRRQPEYNPQATGFSGDIYTQRLDAAGDDARNIVRELRSAVIEDNRESRYNISHDIMRRQFNDINVSMKAYELLRTK
jgi:hypothetical protein